MNVRIVTASAGTGKTTRLAQLLNEAVTGTTARPGAILATTFTKQAAAELLNRARAGLLQNGKSKEAQALLTSRIGTVNAVCGSLVTDFSLELGLSPELRVLDESGAELTLRRALATSVTDEVSDRLQAFRGKFDFNFDWHYEVRRLIEAARANGLDADRLAGSADRSVSSLDECLGPVADAAAVLDGGLRSAIEGALAAIAAGADLTKGTKEYCDFLTQCRWDLDRGRLRWGDWASLCSREPRQKSLPHAAPVKAAAGRHTGHPRLREEMHELIRLIFDVAAGGLRAYQELKRAQGLLDFVDQEVLALELLSRPGICDVLRDEIDLVLVDEFQDTSPLQLAIFLRLAELAQESVWVGDPKQAIYGFRGTDPALMDAAIESLSTPSRDPDLVAAAVNAVTREARVETLSRSYRSRPDLVNLTNAIFSRAFSVQQGMPKERIEIVPTRSESDELGAAVSQWPLVFSGRATKASLAQSVAAGARDLLATNPVIWDRHTGTHRPALAGDLAILCRTNDQCQYVSEALGQLGISAVVARVGLLEAAEAQVLVAGLRLWVDKRDSLAAATLARILEHPQDATSFIENVLAPDGHERLGSIPAVAAVLGARERTPDLDVIAAIDAIADCLDLRRLCGGWGGVAQRLGNLDALRAHATNYVDERMAGGSPPSLVGFLAYLDDLAQDDGWGQSRGDTIARVGSNDAVTVSTWHAAKGLEWPLVVLFGLESIRKPEAYGVHVLSDRTTFDLSDPLGGRWVHFWPNPYTTGMQGGPVKDAYARSATHEYVSRQMQREALRVLYVGWTRARDRLVLSAHQGKLLDGLLKTLSGIDPTLIRDTDVTAVTLLPANWAGHAFQLQVTPAQPAMPIPVPPSPGHVRVGRIPIQRVPASLLPSSAPPRPARLGQPVSLGTPVRMRRAVDTASLGDAVHAFLAADDPRRATEQRLEMGAGLLQRHRVAEALEPADLVELADRLWRWTRGQFGDGATLRTEWPVGSKLGVGTRVFGTADLLVETPDTMAVIDHKSFGLSTATLKADLLAGQLGSYADASRTARPGRRVSTWVHLPFEGVVVEVIDGAGVP